MSEEQKPVRLQANRRKIQEAILLIIEEGEAIGYQPTQYDIVKTMFMADVDHLERCGRPVTFDNYFAMENGPVGQTAYEMLKPHEAATPPWQTTSIAGSTIRKYSSPLRPADRRLLSRSDIRALQEAFAKVRALGFGKVKDETHRHPAYKAAWQPDGPLKSYRMDYAKIAPGREVAEDLAYASKHA